MALVGISASRYKAKWGSSVDHSVAGSRNDHDSLLLVYERPSCGARPNGTLHEKRVFAQKCIAGFLLWFGPLEFGRAQPQPFRGAQATLGCVRDRATGSTC